MNIRNGLSLGALALALISVAPANAQIINGSFESPSLGGASSFAAISNWGGTGTYGTAQNLAGGYQATGGAAQGSQYAYLQFATTTIYQDVTLSAGTYNLSWFDAGRVAGGGFGGNTTYDFRVEGSILSSFTTVSGQAFAAKNTNFTVITPGITQLRFTVTNSGGAGADNTTLIDNVVLSPISVPEPGALGLLALAGPGLALFVRRRK